MFEATKIALEEFEEAVRIHDRRGSYHPDDMEAIEYNYQIATQNLVARIEATEKRFNEARDGYSRLRYPDTTGQ